MRLTPEELRARKRRNVWIASALVAFIVLVFATTVLRLQQNQAAERALATAVETSQPSAVRRSAIARVIVGSSSITTTRTGGVPGAAVWSEVDMGPL